MLLYEEREACLLSDESFAGFRIPRENPRLLPPHVSVTAIRQTELSLQRESRITDDPGARRDQTRSRSCDAVLSTVRSFHLGIPLRIRAGD